MEKLNIGLTPTCHNLSILCQTVKTPIKSGQNVGPNLGPNCLKGLSADDNFTKKD